MAIINKLLPLLEIDLGSKKLFYSSQAMKIRDGNTIKQFEGKLKSEGGINRSFSLQDFKSSITFSNSVSVINDSRLQDIFLKSPEGFTSVSLSYLYAGADRNINDTTYTIDKIIGIASNPSWDKLSFNMTIKDSQKLYYKNVPTVFFDQKTFQISNILQDVTTYTSLKPVGDPSNISSGSTKLVTMVESIRSSGIDNRPENFWKGARVDVIADQRASDDTNNASGQFGVVVKSSGPYIYFNTNLDRFLQRDDETAIAPINNTLFSDIDIDPSILTFQIIKNPVPQNADSVGSPIPILYGAPEKVPMVWSIGQKSTRTNSFGVGDDIYVFASHACKLGPMPDSTIAAGLTSTGANNGVFTYEPDDIFIPPTIHKEITDALKTEVYWSLEDKRVVDARISPGNKNWIPNPFPKRWKNSGSDPSNSYRDHVIRLISPLHKIKKMTTLKGELVHAVQLRGGELDWFDLTYPIEQRGQYPIRYGMGNSKLYISVEGIEDNLEGFYTGFAKTLEAKLQIGNDPENLENEQRTTLIKNPADIMLHFIMNYSSTEENQELIDIDSFRKSRTMLENWRFDTAITEVTTGQEIIDRFCQQSCSIIFMDKGKFKIKTIIPSKMYPKVSLIENEHLYEMKLEFTKTEDIYNSFVFYYGYDHPNEKYSKVIYKDKTNSELCRSSYSSNGFERSKPAINFRDIIDEYTANELADILTDIYSKRRTYISCSVAYSNEIIDANIEIGDCVNITTEQAPGKWVDKPCIVLETSKFFDHMEIKVVEI